MGCASSKDTTASPEKPSQPAMKSAEAETKIVAHGQPSAAPKQEGTVPPVPPAKEAPKPAAPTSHGAVPDPSTAKPAAAQNGTHQPAHEQEEKIGELKPMAKKKGTSIRRGTPQVKSMTDSIKRASRENTANSSRSSSMASVAIEE